MSKTQVQLRTLIRERCDMENSNVVTDGEINRLINVSLGALRDLLINAYGSDFFVEPTAYTFSTVDGTSAYALPTDSQKIVGVDLVESSTVSYSLKPFPFRERNYFQTDDPWEVYTHGESYWRYRTVGNRILLKPTPTKVKTIAVWYVPKVTDLNGDSDSTPDVIEDNWLDWLVLDVCIKIRTKTEESIQEYFVQRSDIEKKIKDIAEERMFGEPMYATDFSGKYSGYRHRLHGRRYRY